MSPSISKTNRTTIAKKTDLNCFTRHWFSLEIILKGGLHCELVRENTYYTPTLEQYWVNIYKSNHYYCYYYVRPFINCLLIQVTGGTMMMLIWWPSWIFLPAIAAAAFLPFFTHLTVIFYAFFIYLLFIIIIYININSGLAKTNPKIQMAMQIKNAIGHLHLHLLCRKVNFFFWLVVKTVVCHHFNMTGFDAYLKG